MTDPPVKVVDKVYIGSLNTAMNNNLSEYGIKLIINLSGARYHSDIKKIDFDLSDTLVEHKDTTNYIKTFATAVAALEVGLVNGSVLVHCAAGINRSAMCIAMYCATIGYTYKMIVHRLASANKKRDLPVLTNISFDYMLKCYCDFTMFIKHRHIMLKNI